MLPNNRQRPEFARMKPPKGDTMEVGLRQTNMAAIINRGAEKRTMERILGNSNSPVKPPSLAALCHMLGAVTVTSAPRMAASVMRV